MKHYLRIFLMACCCSLPGKASDRPEDVIEKAERALAVNSYSYDNDQQDCKGDILLDPASAELALANAKLLPNFLKKGIAARIPAEFHAQKANQHERLLHSLNAMIAFVFEQGNDYKDLENVHSMYPLSYGDDVIPLDCMISFNVQNVRGIEGPIGEIRINSDMLYRAIAQLKFLWMSSLMDFLILWKKNVFPHSTALSYNQVNALALRAVFSDQVKNMCDMYPQHYPPTVRETLGDLLQVSQDIRGSVSVALDPRNFTPIKAIRKALKKNEDLTDPILSKALNEYLPFFLSYLDALKALGGKVEAFIDNPLVCLEPEYVPSLNAAYKAYLKNRVFPGVRFMGAILNFQGLLRELSTRKIVLDSSGQSEGMGDDEGKGAEEGVQGMLPSIGQAEEQAAEQQVICTPDYWKQENRLHQIRKEQERSSIPSQQVNVPLTSYERRLFEFLRDNIFHINMHLSTDQLKSFLKELHFTAEINNNGKGSLHYVGVHPKNAFFGKDEHYQGAYFNIHLPHRDNAVLDPDYFRYLQSGFENIFGLSIEYIKERLLSSSHPLLPGSSPL